MPYSIEEDHWLTSRLVQTQETLWSVPIGEDVLRELLLFSIGVVPSRFYLLSTCHVFAERIWKVLEMHQGNEDYFNNFQSVLFDFSLTHNYPFLSFSRESSQRSLFSSGQY
jgi:hypothetical protein